MKFLVLWHLEPARLSAEVVRAVLAVPKFAEKLRTDGKLECRCHWIVNTGTGGFTTSNRNL